jgi:hypothetical protein
MGKQDPYCTVICGPHSYRSKTHIDAGVQAKWDLKVGGCMVHGACVKPELGTHA